MSIFSFKGPDYLAQCRQQFERLKVMSTQHVEPEYHDHINTHDFIEIMHKEGSVKRQRRVTHYGLLFWKQNSIAPPNQIIDDHDIGQSSATDKVRSESISHHIGLAQQTTLADISSKDRTAPRN